MLSKNRESDFQYVGKSSLQTCTDTDTMRGARVEVKRGRFSYLEIPAASSRARLALSDVMSSFVTSSMPGALSVLAAATASRQPRVFSTTSLPA